MDIRWRATVRHGMQGLPTLCHYSWSPLFVDCHPSLVQCWSCSPQSPCQARNIAACHYGPALHGTLGAELSVKLSVAVMICKNHNRSQEDGHLAQKPLVAGYLSCMALSNIQKMLPSGPGAQASVQTQSHASAPYASVQA